ncbi:MAG: hypothetical protein GY830_09430 [Bacteroidetes bacterium]|nr:hypothetical protein [Bacteroidota bacterium]
MKDRFLNIDFKKTIIFMIVFFASCSTLNNQNMKKEKEKNKNDKIDDDFVIKACKDSSPICHISKIKNIDSDCIDEISDDDLKNILSEPLFDSIINIRFNKEEQMNWLIRKNWNLNLNQLMYDIMKNRNKDKNLVIMEDIHYSEYTFFTPPVVVKFSEKGIMILRRSVLWDDEIITLFYGTKCYEAKFFLKNILKKITLENSRRLDKSKNDFIQESRMKLINNSRKLLEFKFIDYPTNFTHLRHLIGIKDKLIDVNILHHMDILDYINYEITGPLQKDLEGIINPMNGTWPDAEILSVKKPFKTDDEIVNLIVTGGKYDYSAFVYFGFILLYLSFLVGVLWCVYPRVASLDIIKKLKRIIKSKTKRNHIV